ncbi:hypothetical protein [Mesobacillus zeae]|uniref:DUF3168 domain-containing protein n=1 Tax=Mesobacillus zeae TaxID=1917180 RepID=A0A398B760_9BACI|nr:hypothetical protein [Mesobacillus zeae]RID85672.1 hypothetical protein D1970_08950 [Mesobacillus zeae]
MMNLLKYLFTLLSQAQKPVYFEQAPEKDSITLAPPKFPYIVFKLPDSLNVENDRQDYSLIIDIWDNRTDTTALENLTSQVDKLLYRLRVTDMNQFLMFERENRLMIPDEDTSIKRRQLQYTVKQYER